MKLLKFIDTDNNIKTGIIRDGKIRETGGEIFSGYRETGKSRELSGIRLCPPCAPSKIIAVGLNYRDHAEEMGKTPPEEPMIFLKPSTSVIASGEDIVYPGHMSERVDYEGELAVVIGKRARMVKQEDAGKFILGYTCINDVTARDLQAKDIQFTRGKGFDTFAPIGPYIETEIDPSGLEIKTIVNGEIRQHSNTENLIFDVPRLVSFVSEVMTLLPGDIIATGTPGGIGTLTPGDTVEVEIEGIGKLTNSVRADS